MYWFSQHEISDKQLPTRVRGGSSLDSARKKARLEGVLGDSDSARAIFVGLDADS